MKKSAEDINYQKVAGLAYVVSAISSELEIYANILKEDSGQEPIITSEEFLKHLRETSKKICSLSSEIQGYANKIKNEL